MHRVGSASRISDSFFIYIFVFDSNFLTVFHYVPAKCILLIGNASIESNYTEPTFLPQTSLQFNDKHFIVKIAEKFMIFKNHIYEKEDNYLSALDSLFFT